LFHYGIQTCVQEEPESSGIAKEILSIIEKEAEMEAQQEEEATKKSTKGKRHVPMFCCVI